MRRVQFRHVEYLLSAVITAGLVYSFFFFFKNQRFPQPFFYDVGDTWMDWFNPAYWSHKPGTYDTYLSIYPPLTFVFLKFLTNPACYELGAGGWSRECDVYGIVTLHLTYVVCVYFTIKHCIRVDRVTALPRSIALTIGLPMLWALDRGNVILFAYLFMLFAYGPLLKSSFWRQVCAGLAVNMKVYLIGAILAQLLCRRWRWVERALIATVVIYLLSFLFFGAGTPVELYRNVTGFAETLTINNPLDIWMASSLKGLFALTRSDIFPSVIYIGSRNVQLIEMLVPRIILFAQVCIVVGAIACYIRPEAVPRYRVTLLAVGLAILTSEVGAYSQILVLFLCFMEKSDRLYRKVAIILGYIVCIPLDYTVDELPPLIGTSFFFQRELYINYVIQIGPFIRPVLTLLIPVTLALGTISDVWQDIRNQGWSSRYRFRRDVPLLPWVRRPSKSVAPAE